MSLEKKVAIIEVTFEDLRNRLEDYDKGSHLRGIVNEARILVQKYEEARRADRKRDFREANNQTGEFAIAAKNLADNLNWFMQAVYGPERQRPHELATLETNLAEAPLTDTGETLYATYSKTHNFSKENPLIIARNLKGHAKGHRILRKDGCEKSSMYVIEYKDGSYESVADWLDRHANAYLDMAVTCLTTISEKEQERLTRRIEPAQKVWKRQAYNYVRKHTARVATVATAVLLTAGAVGGMLGTRIYQLHHNMQFIQSMDGIHSRNSFDEGNYREAYWLYKSEHGDEPGMERIKNLTFREFATMSAQQPQDSLYARVAQGIEDHIIQVLTPYWTSSRDNDSDGSTISFLMEYHRRLANGEPVGIISDYSIEDSTADIVITFRNTENETMNK